MRKASMVLGIIGGVLTLALSALFIAYNIYLMTIWSDDETAMKGAAYAAAFIDILMPDFLTAVAGILGLIGALIVKKKHAVSGALMIIGAVLCIISMLMAFSFFYSIAIALFVIAAVFALKPERTAQAPPPPPHIPLDQLQP